MPQLTSKDGTTIGYDENGKGPAVILVDGAMVYREFHGGRPLAAELSKDFTVITYDRRGRGESTDTQPYAVEREIEDIEALINEVGGSAFVCGISSGAALAMEAAIKLGNKIKKLAMYEAPYNTDEPSRQAWKEYTKRLRELLAADRRGDAVALFMSLVGATGDQIDGMRQAPVWPMFEAIAPTLVYDHIAILGEDASVPTERAARVAVPTLIMGGFKSDPNTESKRQMEMAIQNAIIVFQ
jgi:pimeloyl-ACP methyl ester carboxylesterase